MSETSSDSSIPRDTLFREVLDRTGSLALRGAIEDFTNRNELYDRFLTLIPGNVFDEIVPPNESRQLKRTQGLCWICINTDDDGVQMSVETAPPPDMTDNQFMDLTLDLVRPAEAEPFTINMHGFLMLAAQKCKLLTGVSIIQGLDPERVLPILHVPSFFYREAYTFLNSDPAFRSSYTGPRDREHFAPMVAASFYSGFLEMKPPS